MLRFTYVLNVLPNTPKKKLHAGATGLFRILKKLGIKACLLDLPLDLTNSPVFNVVDLFPYRGTFKPPVIFFVCLQVYHLLRHLVYLHFYQYLLII